MKTLRTRSLLMPCLLAAACAGEPENAPPSESTQGTAPAAEAPSVTIVSPTEGAFQEEREVTVVLRSTIRIVPAGDMTPGTGHHHLYLDADLGDMSAPVPTVPGSIVHMGDGATAYTFENVSSGPHRVVAVVADGAHVPLQPLVVDTVRFVVE